jgi:protein disulfide-isomerase
MVYQITKRSVIDSRFAKWAGMLFLLSLDYPRRTPQTLEVKKNRMMNCSKLSTLGFPTIYFVMVQMPMGKSTLKV